MVSSSTSRRNSLISSRFLVAGLFCVTLATLVLEVLDSRLLSVLAWYHLSFLAVSVAMLGMAAGAVLVFVSGERRGWLSADRLPGLTAAFAVAIAVSHVVNLNLPFPPVRAVTAADVALLAAATAVLTVPFVLSGIVVTLALTRTSASIGILYGADLIGAAAGCLVVMALLTVTDIASAAFATAAVAALGAWCFARALRARGRAAIAIAVVLAAAAVVNASLDHPLGVRYPKNRSVWPLLHTVEHAEWNSHSYVLVRHLEQSRAWLWGPGTRVRETPATVAWAMIDGEAGTPITQWDGNVAALEWVQGDVTTLPYRLRRGSAGIIGVGGGRDVLTAIWGGNSSITGIEVNRTFVDLLTGPYRRIAGIADRPGVTLVNDEARSYLTRTGQRFDVLQMSLIDTWASTGAGAFTLTENGLYTREAWQVFLRALTPDGVFSVSRWYAPGAVSETTRLLALGVAALVDAGVAEPSRHLALASAGHIATLMISPGPFSNADRVALEGAAATHGFDLLVTPWQPSADGRIAGVVAASSQVDLRAAVADPHFDFSPPTDARPFFFNMLTLRGVIDGVKPAGEGVITGNLVATSTLLALLGVTLALVIAIIGAPLALVGKPDLPTQPFLWSLLYFALIGCGFMFVQMPFLQRFSVYLGHPTYTFSIILFLMILSAGLGSLLSERIGRWSPRPIALGIAALIAVEALALQSAMDGTIGWGLPGRTAVVAAFVVPLACALGLCFPIGMRLAGRHSARVTAWMWGVNGACSVLATIVAVMVSIWLGIEANLWLASGMYALLALPMRSLARRPTSTDVVPH